MGFQNVIAGNGLGISLTGMVIVFCGLMLISLFIALLPKILTLALDSQRDTKGSIAQPVTKTESNAEIVDQDELDVVSIIGLVLFMEQERLSGNPSIISNLNIWGTAGRSMITPIRRGRA